MCVHQEVSQEVSVRPIRLTIVAQALRLRLLDLRKRLTPNVQDHQVAIKVVQLRHSVRVVAIRVVQLRHNVPLAVVALAGLVPVADLPMEDSVALVHPRSDLRNGVLLLPKKK
jgi:hypothetical protein